MIVCVYADATLATFFVGSSSHARGFLFIERPDSIHT